MASVQGPVLLRAADRQGQPGPQDDLVGPLALSLEGPPIPTHTTPALSVILARYLSTPNARRSGTARTHDWGLHWCSLGLETVTGAAVTW